MGLVTNGARFAQTEIPNRNCPKFFVNGKRPVPLFLSAFIYLKPEKTFFDFLYDPLFPGRSDSKALQ